jgi:uncharacterized protein (TIGR03663 family)
MATRTLDRREARPTVAPAAAPRPAPAWLDRPFWPLIRLDGERWLYAGLVFFAVLTRFWDLGSRAQHHDESLHDVYSYYLFEGGKYIHDPLMHGPFQFHGIAASYFLFGGANDITARLLAACFGVLLVLTPWFLRRELGRAGALVTATLFAITPLIFFYGRFARNEPYHLVFVMLMVIGVWGYLRSDRLLYLGIFSAGLALAWSDKTITHIESAIFLVFFGLRALPQLGRVLTRAQPFRGARRDLGFTILLATLAIPQFAAATEVLLKWRGITLNQPATLFGLSNWPFAPNGAAMAITQMQVFGLAVTVALLALTAVIGLSWNPRTWLLCAGIFYGIYILFFSTFFTNAPGIGSGFWGQLDYWLQQQTVQRGSQPNYYYFLLVPLYEYLSLVFAAGAIVTYAMRLLRPRPAPNSGDAPVAPAIPAPGFTAFLIFWIVAAFVAYSYAGEKMPWLGVHMALPMALLAGKFIGEILSSVAWRAALRRNGIPYLGLHVLIAALALAAFVGIPQILPIDSALPSAQSALLEVGAMLGVVAVFVLVTWGLRPFSPFRTGPALAIGVAAVLGVLTLVTSFRNAYAHGDIPIEMDVYTQTSPRVPEIARAVDRIADESGKGKDMKITVDSASGFTWPWAWYLRDYRQVGYIDLSSGQAPLDSQVLLVHASNEERLRGALSQFTKVERYPHRWWFPEDYRSVGDWLNAYNPDAMTTLSYEQLTLDAAVVGTLTPKGLHAIWDYFLFRELRKGTAEGEKALGSEDGVFYVRKGLSGEEVKPPATLPVALTFGKKGSGPGELSEPKGVAVDSRGNIFVADTMNNRIQKFGPDGAFLAQVGRKGGDDGEFNEPWGLAVDADNNLCVADLWNHRIQKFDNNLKFLTKFGTYADTGGKVQPNPGQFFGPRGIAIAPDGTLLVTDTGNKRVQRFDRDGKFLAAYGGAGSGPGQFNEPVGVTVDAQGRIWIADLWNYRIQSFDSNFAFQAQFPVSGWDVQSLANKPYLVVTARGDVIATDPEGSQLLRFSASGQFQGPIGRFGPDRGNFTLPVGIAQDSAGNLYVVEAGNNRVQKLAPPS